jgi:uncharacterized protein UPF0164
MFSMRPRSRLASWPTALALAAILLAIASPRSAHATKYAGEFLKMPAGARAMGMGGAFVAVGDDASAVMWNPAGIILLPYHELLPMHAEAFGSLVNYDFGGLVWPLDGGKGKHRALGLGFVRLGVNDIAITPRPEELQPGDWVDDGPDGQPFTGDPGENDGKWEPGERLTQQFYDKIRNKSSSDMAGLISYAFQKGEHWAFGGSLKFVRQSLPNRVQNISGVDTTYAFEDATSFGAGIDVGMLYMHNDVLTFGAVVHDLTTTYLAWSNGTREYIVPTIDTGSSWNFYPAPHHSGTVALDIAWEFEDRRTDSSFHLGTVTGTVRAGTEYWYRNTVALRAGAFGPDLTLGAGVRYKQIGVDYAAVLNRFFAKDAPDFPSDQNLDTTHRISGTFNW